MGDPVSSGSEFERRLVAILGIDVARYTSLMEGDEEGTLDRLQAVHRLIGDTVTRHHGRTFGAAGDGIMAEFPSPVEAIRAAIVIQQEVAKANTDLDAPMRLRIGAHLGDVISDGGNLYGDGVNIAARLEQLAEPGALCASAAIVEQVRGKVGIEFRDIGERVLRNLQTPVRAYSARIGPDSSVRRATGHRRRNTAVVSLLGVFVAGIALYYQADPDSLPLLGVQTVRRGPEAPALPSLVVMPFSKNGQSEDSALLADGIAEDLTTDLGKFRTLLVYATEAVQTTDGAVADLSGTMRELKPSYIVEGAVQQQMDRLRINVRLIDGRDGRQIWADRWDRPKTDLFDLQDDITQAVAMTLPAELRNNELDRLKTRRTNSLDAYQLWLRARQTFDDPTPEANETARALLERALQLDPKFARARGHLSYTYAQDVLYGWSSDPDATTTQAVALAEEAVRQDPNDYDNHWSLGIALLLAGDLERSLVEYARAAEMNPNDATLLAEMGDALVQAGRAEDAVVQVRKAIARHPNGPGWYFWNLGFAQYMSRDYAGAILTYESAQDLPEEARADVAAAYAMRGGTGDRERAALILAEYRQANPDYTLAVAGERAFARPSDREHYLKGLRLAGLPEA